jgi:hypothetical protein
MIKKFENFVNEGFLDNVLAGIDAGIGGYKANRRAEQAAEAELEDIMRGESKVNIETQMSVLLNRLLMRVVTLARNFENDGKHNTEGYISQKLDSMEEIMKKLRKLSKSIDDEIDWDSINMDIDNISWDN